MCSIYIIISSLEVLFVNNLLENEYEIVPYRKIRHIHIFLINITYRNFHLHNDIEIFAVIAGRATFRRSSGTTVIKPGSIVIINSNEAHEIDAAGGSVTAIGLQLSSHFIRDYFPRLHNTVFATSEICSQLTPEKCRQFWSCLINASFNYIQSQELFELRCISEVCRLLELLIGNIDNNVINENEYLARKKISQRMSRLFSYIDENYQYPIRLAEVAETEGITPTHLSHFFTENFGISFQQYLSNIRFEHAVRLMDNQSMSISDIAAASGFSDLKYMTQMFTKRFGCKPKEFREMLTSSDSEQLTSAHHLSQYYYSDEQSLQLLETAFSQLGELFPLDAGANSVEDTFDALTIE